MKVVSRKQYDAVQFDGTGPGLLKVLETFPDAFFRIEMDEGTICLSIRKAFNDSLHLAIDAGEYVIFEDTQFNVYDEESFFKYYTYVEPDKDARAKYDPIVWGEKEVPETDWIPYNPLRENIGSDGTKWYEQPLDIGLGRYIPEIPTEEQF